MRKQVVVYEVAVKALHKCVVIAILETHPIVDPGVIDKAVNFTIRFHNLCYGFFAETRLIQFCSELARTNMVTWLANREKNIAA